MGKGAFGLGYFVFPCRNGIIDDDLRVDEREEPSEFIKFIQINNYAVE